VQKYYCSTGRSLKKEKTEEQDLSENGLARWWFTGVFFDVSFQE